MTLKTSKTAKVFAGVVGFAMVLTFVFGATAPVAKADASTDALMALIASLQAQIAALTGGSSSTTVGGSAPMGPLTNGSSGAEVTKLQNFLISKGFGITAGATGYFGGQTQAALAAFQAANGVTPASGYYGSVTAAKVASMMTTTTTTTTTTNTTTTTGLSGDAGSVDSYDLQSEFNNEDVGEGEENVKIMSFEVDADDGSDLEFTSMKVWFENQDTNSSEDLSDFADSVQIWLDGKEVGSADVDSFSADDTSGTETDNSTSDSVDEWTKSITLHNAVVEAGETAEFVVSISANNNIDSVDHDSDDWDVKATNVRFKDATGTVINEDPSLDETAFNFGTFASSADVEMKVTLDNDSPDSQVIDVDASDETESVDLLKFSIKAEGSDITINDLPFLLTVDSGSTTITEDVDFITNALKLTVDGHDYTENVSTSAGTTATVTFDNLDLTINEGDKVSFTLSADINDTQVSEFADGDTLKAELTSTQVDAIDADDQEGDSISDTDATGTALGDAMAFYDTGIKVTLVGTPSATSIDGGVNAYDGTGTFVIKYKVEAFGAPMYVSDSAVATTAATIVDLTTTTEGVRYLVDGAGTATTANLSTVVTFTTSDGATDSGITHGVEIGDGESATFTLTATRTNDTSGDAGLFRVLMKAITWATSDTGTQNVYDFDLEDYKTDSVSIN